MVASLAQLQALAGSLTSSVKDNVVKAVQNAKTVVDNVVKVVKDASAKAAATASRLAQDATKTVIDVAKDLSDKAKDLSDDVVDAAVDTTKNAVDTITDYYNIAGGGAGKYTFNVVADVAGFTKAVNDLIKDNNQLTIDAVNRNINAVREEVGETLVEERKDFLSVIGGTLSATTEELARSFSGVADAIFSLPVMFVNYASSVFLQRVSQTLNKLLEIPSKAVNNFSAFEEHTKDLRGVK